MQPSPVNYKLCYVINHPFGLTGLWIYEPRNGWRVASQIVGLLFFWRCLSFASKKSSPTFQRMPWFSDFPKGGRLYVCHAHNVSKDASRGDGSACSVALDEHGIFVVAFCGEQDNIVGTLQIVEGMALWNFA